MKYDEVAAMAEEVAFAGIGRCSNTVNNSRLNTSRSSTKLKAPTVPNLPNSTTRRCHADWVLLRVTHGRVQVPCPAAAQARQFPAAAADGVAIHFRGVD